MQTSGKSSGNTVTINDGTVKNSVLGGHSAMSDAIGNTVNIAGGIIGTESSGTGEADDNAIAGGFAEEGQANNNTVNITGGTLGAMMSLYGGYSEKGSSGNTLNLHTKGNTVKNLGYFQNLNFYVPEGTAAGETMVTVTGNADVSKAVIQAGIEKTTKLAPGQAINLIYDAGGIKTDGTSYSMMSGKDIVSDAGFVDRKAAVKNRTTTPSSSMSRKTKKAPSIRTPRSFRKTVRTGSIPSRTQAISFPMQQKAHGKKTMTSMRNSCPMPS